MQECLTMAKPKFRCPACNHVLSVSDYAKFLGSLGGAVTGPNKARTSEQARAAANARWAKRKEAKGKTN